MNRFQMIELSITIFETVCVCASRNKQVCHFTTDSCDAKEYRKCVRDGKADEAAREAGASGVDSEESGTEHDEVAHHVQVARAPAHHCHGRERVRVVLVRARRRLRHEPLLRPKRQNRLTPCANIYTRIYIYKSLYIRIYRYHKLIGAFNYIKCCRFSNWTKKPYQESILKIT